MSPKLANPPPRLVCVARERHASSDNKAPFAMTTLRCCLTAARSCTRDPGRAHHRTAAERISGRTRRRAYTLVETRSHSRGRPSSGPAASLTLRVVGRTLHRSRGAVSDCSAKSSWVDCAATNAKRAPGDDGQVRVIFWLRGPDLNRRPSGYEPDELPDCSTPR